MIRPTRVIHSICLAGSLATTVSCDNTPGPLFPTLDLSLASQLGATQDFFEGEPIYVVFSLMIVMDVNYLRPDATPALAQELAGSLAGDVAASLVNR